MRTNKLTATKRLEGLGVKKLSLRAERTLERFLLEVANGGGRLKGVLNNYGQGREDGQEELARKLLRFFETEIIENEIN